MENQRKLHLTLLNLVFRKNMMRVFLEFKYLSKQSQPYLNSRLSPKNTIRKANLISKDRIQKTFSMTEDFLSQNTEESKNFFEELKQSLTNKITQGDFTPIKNNDKIATQKFVHNKNSFSLNGNFLSKGIRKNLVRSTPDTVSDVAVVSSSSLVNLNREKKINIFVKK